MYLGREADALEAVDEAVYQALRALGQLREAAFFETWLTRILLNTCHRELRRRNRFHPGGEDALPDTAGPDAYDGLPLREAVGRLPEELRAVVILRFFTGYTQSETAQAWGFPREPWPPGSGRLWPCCGWSWERRMAHEPEYGI